MSKIRKSNYDIYIKKLIPEDRLKLIELFNLNYSMSSIARYFKIHRSTVFYHLRNAGFKFDKNNKNHGRQNFSVEKPKERDKIINTKLTKLIIKKKQKTYQEYLNEEKNKKDILTKHLRMMKKEY